jgi:hypothetical protein
MTIKMGTVQIIARTIAMLCVPIVMLAKPLSREMGGNEDIFSISVILFTMIIFHIATQCTSNAVKSVLAQYGHLVCVVALVLIFNPYSVLCSSKLHRYLTSLVVSAMNYNSSKEDKRLYYLYVFNMREKSIASLESMHQ